ncbi:FAD-dependent oxidoreductase [Achromobacter seleniivolatilans]|uniref:FAD-dependent oxidoreductase n=1 Tax=Achromobacter seleniivolatilans TaxID=3047478 RepID=A0ABY9LY74_9BURK|nr:FAD-dependent oxidoreductase [Achromobacter sp. R39]WMD19204.1 FAD-dependent oxidoreductase [Achromobacter sp. R39]
MTQRIETEVAIIGGGIVGASAALFLRRQGVPVVLLEAALCGAKASGVNYGGVRRQGRGLEQMPLTQRAHELWGQLPELIGIDGEYVRSGHLKLAFSDADMALLEAYRDRTRGFGMNLELLDRRALSQRFGWLGQNVAGGSFCPEDGHANPRLVSPAFGRAASALGADVREGVRVTSAEHDGSRFIVRAGDELEVRSRYLLNCAGAWAGRYAESFGEAVPETAIHPLMMVTEPLPVFMHVSLGVQGGGIYARQVARGNCVIGGGRGVSSGPDLARPGRANVGALMANATQLLPVLQGAQVIRFWTGVEGNMPDHNPVLGPSAKVPGLFHAFGLSGAGFQIGPAVGEVLSELVVRGQSSIPIDAFRIERYTDAAHGAVARPESVREQTLESP